MNWDLHAHIDVASHNPAKHHQHDAVLHLVVAMDVGKKAGDEVVLMVLILPHCEHGIPLLALHLLLYGCS